MGCPIRKKVAKEECGKGGAEEVAQSLYFLLNFLCPSGLTCTRSCNISHGHKDDAENRRWTFSSNPPSSLGWEMHSSQGHTHPLKVPARQYVEQEGVCEQKAVPCAACQLPHADGSGQTSELPGASF